MALYGCPWNATNTVSSTVPILGLLGGTGARARLMRHVIGCDAAPADQASTFAIYRHTTALSGGTAGTPSPFDPADNASVTTYMYGASIGAPTLGVQLFRHAVNQKNTYTWVALDERNAIVVPATANNGINLMPVVSTAAANHTGTWEFIE